MPESRQKKNSELTFCKKKKKKKQLIQWRKEL